MLQNPRKNEELLTKSVKYFHDLFKSSEAAMMIIEPESGTVSDANGAACRCFGLAYKDLVGQKAISNIRSHPVITHDDIAEAVAKQKVLAFMHTKTNGDVHEVEIFGYPVFLEGHRMLHTIIRDVSSGRESVIRRQHGGNLSCEAPVNQLHIFLSCSLSWGSQRDV